MEPEPAAKRSRIGSPRLLLALAALLVLIVVVETRGPRAHTPSVFPAGAVARNQMLSSARITADRLYYDARTGNLADAEQIASPEAIRHLFRSWSKGQEPSVCATAPGDRLADFEVRCQGVAQGGELFVWLDHEVGSVTFHVRDVAIGRCDPASPSGAFSCDYDTGLGW